MRQETAVKEPGGAIWHVTARGNDRRDIFRDDDDREKFLQFFGAAAKRNQWKVLAYTLMTNHYHFVIETPIPTLSRGMHSCNSRYAMYFNARHKRVGHLFQGRFKGILVDSDRYRYEVMRYTELNAVRARMVAHPGDYAWSSYRAHAGTDTPPTWLSMEWMSELDLGRGRARETWRDFVAAQLESTESLWNGLAGQIYLGSELFVERMRQLVQKKLRSDEHPLVQRLRRARPMEAVKSVVAKTCGVDRGRLQQRGRGVERLLCAWIGWNEAFLTLREVAAGMRLRSAGYVSTLVRSCEESLARDGLMREMLESACTALEKLPTLRKA
jgi:REP element-mobilizing transposase RayT